MKQSLVKFSYHFTELYVSRNSLTFTLTNVEITTVRTLENFYFS